MALINGIPNRDTIFKINLSEALTRLPYYLQTRLFKVTRDCDLTDGSINLLTFQNWLEKIIKNLLRPMLMTKLKTKQYQYMKDQLYTKIRFI